MRRVAVLVVLALSPTLAVAQSDVPETAEARPAVFKPVTEIDFRAADVRASADGPQIRLVPERTPGDHQRLIVLRANFNPELEQSAGDVR